VLTKRHSEDPVPFVLSGPGIAPNSGLRLTEREAAAAGLMVDPGYKLMSMRRSILKSDHNPNSWRCALLYW
jgi:2,3-bisphosphoglycerate-independent phosphoglycerate mutase